MAGVQFWPEMSELSPEFLAYAKIQANGSGFYKRNFRYQSASCQRHF